MRLAGVAQATLVLAEPLSLRGARAASAYPQPTYAIPARRGHIARPATVDRSPRT